MTRGLTSFEIEKPENYKKFQSFLFQEGKTVKQVFNDIIDKTALQYDGLLNGLDRFVSPDFVPTPLITADFQKHIDYLKTIEDNDILGDLEDQFYRLHIMARAIRAEKPSERRNFNLGYLAAWNRFR